VISTKPEAAVLQTLWTTLNYLSQTGLLTGQLTLEACRCTLAVAVSAALSFALIPTLDQQTETDPHAASAVQHSCHGLLLKC